MSQKNGEIKPVQGESLLVKTVIAELTLLTAIVNLVIAIINLAEGHSIQFVATIILFFVFCFFDDIYRCFFIKKSSAKCQH